MLNISYNIQIILNIIHTNNTKRSIMADIIKVKAKKNFQWQQDTKYIFVKIPMIGHTSIKNMEIFLSDLVMRITSKIKKYVQTLDFLHQVDYLSAQNKFVLIDSLVHATLKKKQQQIHWQTLTTQNISLVQLKQRRRQSQARYQANAKQIQQNKAKLKTQYDRKATQEMMRFQQEQRRKLQSRKQAEKQQALYQVFKDVNEKTGKIEKKQMKIQDQGKKWDEKGSKALQKLQQQQKQELERQKQKKKQMLQQKYAQKVNKQKQKNHLTASSSKQNTMFTEQDVIHHQNLRNNISETQQIQQIPIRKQAKVGIKFTQKLYPHVATRDYHYTEPPMPKGQLPFAPSRQGDLQNRNPLWLKDRADRFMKDKNYSAALDTYNQALKIQGNNKKILMNRSLAHMKLLNFDTAINDCEAILLQMQKQLLNNQQSKQQSLQDMIKIKTRKAICLAWKGKLLQSKSILNQLLSFQMPAEHVFQLKQCLSMIQKRQASLLCKSKGDEKVKKQSYTEAISYYNKAIQTDNNQYAYSNKGLCLNKSQKYEQSIKICDQGVARIQQFLLYASTSNKSNNEYNNLLMKLLYRKATAQQQLKLMKQSQDTLKKALLLNPQDKDISSALQLLKSRKNAQQFARLKQQASLQLQKNNNPSAALELYSRCLKLCQSEKDKSKIADFLSILQNQCVCYLKLEQYENLISVCIRIISTVNNVRSRVMRFGPNNDKEKSSRDVLSKENLDKIMVRTLVRRANGYVKIGQIYNAKSDLQKAMQIAPKDEAVKAQYDKIIKSTSLT